jgi:uncharacterized RDD family membrane protein YckC
MSEQLPSLNPFDAVSTSSAEADEIWRKEIQARVSRYRTHRGRRVEGAYSMRFPFPPSDENTATGTSPAVVSSPVDVPLVLQGKPEMSTVATDTIPTADAAMPEFVVQQVAAAVEALIAAEIPAQPAKASQRAQEDLPDPLQSQDVPDAVDRSIPAPRPRARRKVIAFPRNLMASPDVAYRLADPVLPEQPRILDVPEELEALAATPFLDGLTFDTKVAQPSSPADHVELPFRPVPLSQRVYAVLVDVALVAAGSTLFAGVAYQLMPKLAVGKSLLATAAVIPMLLWFVYQFLLLVYGGTTPGMGVARVRLMTFSGGVPTMRQRRNRTVGLSLSTASLAMGLLWAFVDVDALCWHDRMSQTYLTGV